MRPFWKNGNWEFETRVYLGLLLLLCGFIPILGGAFYTLHDLVREEREFVELRTHETILTERLNLAFERQLSLVPVFVLTARGEVLDDLHVARTNMHRTLTELEGLADSPEERGAIGEIRKSEADLYAVAQEGIARRQRGQSSSTVNEYFRSRADELTLLLQDKLAQFTRHQGAELERARGALATTANEAVVGLAIVSIFTLLFLGAVTALIVRELRRKAGEDRELEELLRREREISLLRKENVDVVSHDLKNPIAALKLRMQILARHGRENGNIERDLRQALTSVNSMESLVRDLLDHAKMEAGRLALSKRTVSVPELVEGALSRLEPLAAEKEIKLSLFEEPGFPDVECDPGRITQVLDNLLGNALKFTPRGGTIRLSATYQSRQWMISVSDSGPGIREDQLPHVFERFWQDSQTSMKGNGLGLAIAKGIVESHGGRIWVESHPGQGAEFFFTLPLHAEAQPPAPAPPVQL
ncbi:MAG: sensor histidine kinase [Bdellovibrionota bacterium]